MTAPRVLVVEDDQAIRETLLDILDDHGYAPIGAINGRDALDQLGAAAQRPCLILLDLMMPVMDGRMFREEQLRQPGLSAIPVVVISAYGDIGDAAKDLSAVAHLKKPLNLRELLRIVEEHCPLSADAGC